LRTQLVATCVHYWRGAAKILVHVFAVLAVVGNEVVIGILEQLQVAEVQIFLGAADMHSETLESCQQLQPFLRSEKLGDGVVAFVQRGDGNLALTSESSGRHTRIVDGYLDTHKLVQSGVEGSTGVLVVAIAPIPYPAWLVPTVCWQSLSSYRPVQL
jgi:hypothetical protein